MNSLDGAIELIHQKFIEEPFHSLQILYGESLGSNLPGGTCSDKTKSFIDDARKRGFDVSLHSAFIDGREIHRLARLNIDGRVFFADVGNGWPSLYPYPSDEPFIYSCFGMTFRTEISDNMISVYHQIENEEKLQMEIMLTERPEIEIINEIKDRFSSGIIYPFTDRMRFSAIVEGEFRFLRDETLYIYRPNGEKVQIIVAKNQWEIALEKYFGWKIKLPFSEDNYD